LNPAARTHLTERTDWRRRLKEQVRAKINLAAPSDGKRSSVTDRDPITARTKADLAEKRSRVPAHDNRRRPARTERLGSQDSARKMKSREHRNSNAGEPLWRGLTRTDEPETEEELTGLGKSGAHERETQSWRMGRKIRWQKLLRRQLCAGTKSLSALGGKHREDPGTKLSPVVKQRRLKKKGRTENSDRARSRRNLEAKSRSGSYA
jgi:hypothetical protein